MNAGVRLIRRGRDGGPQSLPPGRDAKTERQTEREIVIEAVRRAAERGERQKVTS